MKCIWSEIFYIIQSTVLNGHHWYKWLISEYWIDVESDYQSIFWHITTLSDSNNHLKHQLDIYRTSIL